MDKRPTFGSVETEGMVFARDQQGKVYIVGMTADLQVGSQIDPKSLILAGGLSISASKFAIEAGGSITLPSNTVAARISAAGAASIFLPEKPRIGQVVTIKDIDGNSSTNQISIYGQNGATIDGASSCVIAVDYGSITFCWLESGWSVVDTNISKSLLTFSALNTAITNGAIRFLFPGGSNLSAQLAAGSSGLAAVVPHDGCISKLSVRHLTLGSGGTIQYIARINRLSDPSTPFDTSLSAQLAPSDYSTENSGTYVKVTKGDLIYLKIINTSALTTSPTGMHTSLVYSFLSNSG